MGQALQLRSLKACSVKESVTWAAKLPNNGFGGVEVGTPRRRGFLVPVARHDAVTLLQQYVCQDQPWCLTKEAPCKVFANIVAQNSANRGGSEFCISADVILFFKQPHLSQVRQRSTVVAAAVNNDVINNDVAPSHRRRQMESISKY